MFYKSPANFFNAVFNGPQGLTMTLALSMYQGVTDWQSILKSFVCAYCAGVMLTAFVRIPEAGAYVARLCKAKGLAAYLISNGVAGALMGFLMNFFMTFMAIGPVPYFASAYLHTLGVCEIVSIIASCVWIGFTQFLMTLVYKESVSE